MVSAAATNREPQLDHRTMPRSEQRPATTPDPQPDPSAKVRGLWLFLGIVATGSGIAGTVLPLVPTTPLLLLAAYAFARSSPRLHCWLVEHPRYGPLIRDWQRFGAIRRSAKIAAAVAMVAALGVSLWLGLSGWVVAVQGLVLLAVAVFVSSRPEGPPGGAD